MHGRLVEPAGDHLHGHFITQLADQYRFAQGALCQWEQPLVPGVQALQGQRSVIPLRCIQHQLRQPFTAGIGRSLLLDAQPASEGRADRTHVQLLTFDCRRGDDVLQQRIEDVLALAECIDAADLAQQASLHVDAIA
ncbi:hypothetical protein D3C76_950070 [compost metagenome]